jgi:dipeptidyl aminopeptidase/acylaminoacyl peptidase
MRTCRISLFVAMFSTAAATFSAQESVPADQSGAAAQQAPRQSSAPVNPARAQQLYVSTDPKDHAIGHDFERDVQRKAEIDQRYRQATKGIVDFQKTAFRSRIGDLDIPAYVFQPLEKRGPKGHAAMVWVHGGVHGSWDVTMWPFVREAVARGYVVVCPEYRGSTGYGEAFHKEIDYGGYEVDDVLSAMDYLETLPQVDPDRVGIMGWSHGGYIALLSVFRDQTPFKAAAAIVPVTNLIFRLSYKGPAYQREFATQKRIQGLPFEKPDLYIQRSPLYSVDKLRVPLLVHVATNDTDVNFVEDQQIVDALRARKPELTETKIYVNPPPGPAGGGHTFSRRVAPDTLERQDTPEQIDSWNRTWAFFEWHLRPYLDKSKSPTAPGEAARPRLR